MTINGIWEWASTHSKKLEISSLCEKTLAIDGHIWLYESSKGCQNHHQSGASYLVTFFKRCQRLMEQKIRPIVVFDSVLADNPSTSAVYKCQIMLRHLGVSVIVSTGDGEAQCAQLELAGITQGCISSDFDYFLFGGRNLYRINFEQSAYSIKEILHVSMETLENEKKITRNGLISLAMLLGCDYYQHGISGVGIATGLDILAEFACFPLPDGEEDDPIVILDRFSSYARGEIPERSGDSARKLKLRKKPYCFPAEFPNSLSIRDSVAIYLHPKVLSIDPGTKPPDVDIEHVERILTKECGWTPERMSKEMKMTEKRLNIVKEKVSQTRIPDYFLISRKKRYEPVLERCSLDEYIEANRKWIEAKKQSHTETSPPKTTSATLNLKSRRDRKRPHPRTTNRQNPICLDDSSDEERQIEVITIDDTE